MEMLLGEHLVVDTNIKAKALRTWVLLDHQANHHKITFYLTLKEEATVILEEIIYSLVQSKLLVTKDCLQELLCQCWPLKLVQMQVIPLTGSCLQTERWLDQLTSALKIQRLSLSVEELIDLVASEDL